MSGRAAAEREAHVFDSPQTPCEGEEGDDRVDVEAELGKGAACAGEEGDEAVDAGGLVEEGEEQGDGDAGLEVGEADEGGEGPETPFWPEEPHRRKRDYVSRPLHARAQHPVGLLAAALPKLTSPDGSSGSASSAHPAARTSTTRRASRKYPHSALSVRPALQQHPLIFSQVESFWSVWTHLTPPSVLQPTTDYLLFHTGVAKPVWEDPLNLSGGKWIIRLRKGIADRLWEDLVMAVIGDQFDECAGRDDAGAGDGVHYPEICGCTISVRQHEDIVSIWNRFEADFRVREKIRSVVCILQPQVSC